VHHQQNRTFPIQGTLSDLLAGGECGEGAVFVVNAPMNWNFGDRVDPAALPQLRLQCFKVRQALGRCVDRIPVQSDGSAEASTAVGL
jgi:hypothetical protein